MRKGVFALILVVSVVLSQASHASQKDECKRGTWKQEGEKMYVCPNPGHPSWDNSSSEKVTKKSKTWQNVTKSIEFIQTSDHRLITDKNDLTIIVCNDREKQISLAQNTNSAGMQVSYNVPLGYYFRTKENFLICK